MGGTRNILDGGGATPRRRFLLGAVLIAAFLHALFYVVLTPPWSLLNEPQHLDYVLSLRDDHRIPDIRHPIRSDVAAAVWASERWKTYRQPRPDTPEAALGRRGLSYEGYQPPLYYALMVPIAVVAGHDPLRAMYAIRLVTAALLPALALIAWTLAARWFPGEGDLVPASAALAVAAVPVVASSCARVTNDSLVAALVGGGVLGVMTLVERPSLSRAAAVGMVVAFAVLTKSPGTLLVPVAVIGLAIIWRRGQLSPGVALAALVPVVIASLAWAGWTRARYGVADGTWAFLRIHGGSSAPPLSPLAFLRDLWLYAWVPPPVFLFIAERTKHVGATGLLTLLGVMAAFGLARRPRPLTGIAVTSVLAGGAVAILWVGNIQGLVPPVGRVLMPAYPAIAALTAGGWARLAGSRAALAFPMTVWVTVLAYELLWLVPLIRPGWPRL